MSYFKKKEIFKFVESKDNNQNIVKIIIPVKKLYFNYEKQYFDSYLEDCEFTIVEEWKELYFRGKPSGYMISNLGQVKKPNGEIAPLYYDKDGYTRFCLYIPRNHPVYKNNKRIAYPYKTHRAVAELFITNPNPTEYDIVMHLNDIPDCNYVVNLRWGSAQENMDDKKYSGRSKYLKGEEKPDSIFSEKDAKDICNLLYNENITKKSDIIKKLGYENRDSVFLKSFSNLIANIKRGHCWKYISDQYK